MAKNLNHLSLRAKFRGEDSVEVVVMDDRMDESFILHWNFRETPTTKFVRVQSVPEITGKEDATQYELLGVTFVKAKEEQASKDEVAENSKTEIICEEGKK